MLICKIQIKVVHYVPVAGEREEIKYGQEEMESRIVSAMHCGIEVSQYTAMLFPPVSVPGIHC